MTTGSEAWERFALLLDAAGHGVVAAVARNMAQWERARQKRVDFGAPLKEVDVSEATITRLMVERDEQRARAEAAEREEAKLVNAFCGEFVMEGNWGDNQNLTPAECAIEWMRKGRESRSLLKEALGALRGVEYTLSEVTDEGHDDKPDMDDQTLKDLSAELNAIRKVTTKARAQGYIPDGETPTYDGDRCGLCGGTHRSADHPVNARERP
jgi:hypothetical protein